jgi:hypothetical protein
MMERADSQNATNREFKTDRIVIAGAYLALPVVVCALIWYCNPNLFSSDPPVYWWRFAYCWLAGLWGISFRAFELRETHKKDSPWPDYVTVFPMAALISGSAVFTLLSLFENELEGLFWTAAVPLCTVLGLYARPTQWIITSAVRRQTKDK